MKVEVQINGNLVFTAPVDSIDQGSELCTDLIEQYKIKELQQAGIRASVCMSEVPSKFVAEDQMQPAHFNELLEREVPKEKYA